MYGVDPYIRTMYGPDIPYNPYIVATPNNCEQHLCNLFYTKTVLLLLYGALSTSTSDEKKMSVESTSLGSNQSNNENTIYISINKVFITS